MTIEYKNPPATGSSIGASQFNTQYYEKKALIEAQKEQYFTQLADVASMPKNMGKKIKRVMEAEREKFAAGCAAQGHPEKLGRDLWDAIEETTSEPVRRIMDSWIFQGGFPIIDVDLVIPEGDFIFLVGPSGAGKSTLIKVLTGVHPTEAGAIELEGNSITHRPPARSAGPETLEISAIHREFGAKGNPS